MKSSHTFSLIEEAFAKIQEFNYKRYIDELENTCQNTPNVRSSGRKYKVNQILEKFGFHLMHENKLKELINQVYSKMGKWSSVGTIQLALKNPEKFDEVYNMLADEDSRVTFGWFIKYRVTYAFLGDFVEEIFPPKITETEFLKGMNSIKIDSRNGLISV